MRYIAWWMVVLCGTNAVAAGRSHLTSIRGQIVVLRSAEWIAQVGSFAENRETFLIRLDGRPSDIAKVVYQHFGFSEIPEPSGEKRESRSLDVRRERSCDGTYGQYIAESHGLTDEDKTMQIPAVTMLAGFHGLPQGYTLKCYRLSQGNIHTYEPIPKH